MPERLHSAALHTGSRHRRSPLDKEEIGTIKYFILGGLAATAIALGSAGAANAATTCQDVPTTTGLATFHATQPSGGGGNWDHTFSVNVASDGGFTGLNVIKGLDAGETVTVNETVAGQISDKNNDGVKEVTLTGTRESGFYTFEWSVLDAPMDGKTAR